MKKRSKFSLSNYKLFTCDMGNLVPCGLTEVLPGDTIQHATSALVRLAPLMAPVMHPVHVRIHHWYVPHRLVWEDFEDFITGGPDGMDVSVFPTITFTNGVSQGSLGDYLGIPTGVNNLEVSALPFRGYALIWNEFYRDQDLQAELIFSEESGPDTLTDTDLQRVNWEKDYFTSARPWEQKGPAVTVPLGTTAPVKAPDTVLVPNTNAFVGRDVDDSVYLWNDPAHPLQADLSNASAVTVRALREALALQRFEEARARYGSRYTEYLRYLGLRSSDARLQRPEYLGGGKQTIQFSEVLQTAEGTSPVGELRGHGIGALRSNRYRRFIEEHGYIFTFFSVKPKAIYSQGLHRTWNKRNREDFWQRELEHIGQQEVLNKELYAAHTDPDATFGFQDRYDEYRRTPSSIAGEFRDQILDFWHMARVFSGDPALNSSFITSVPTKRNFAVPSNDILYIMANHSMQARRLVSKRGSSFTY